MTHINRPTAEVLAALAQLSKDYETLQSIEHSKKLNEEMLIPKAEKDIKLFTPMSAGPPKKRGKGKYVRY